MPSKVPLKIVRKHGCYDKFLLPIDTWDSYVAELERQRQDALGEVNVYYFTITHGHRPTEAEAISHYQAHSKTG